jgi:dihydrofolate reductase
MGNVRFHLAMSQDGYIGGIGEQAWPAHMRLLGWVHDLASWRANAGLEGGQVNDDDQVLREATASVGAYVMGRTMFDFGEEPWGDNPPFHAPVFVLTHRPRETVTKEGGTTYTFVVDGIGSAIRQAKEAAGNKDVRIEGGASAAQQALAAGLVDTFELHVIPVLLGGGVRLFDGIGSDSIELERTRVIESPVATHMSYRVLPANSHPPK